MAVGIGIDARELRRMKAQLAHIKGGMQKALTRASRRTATAGKTKVGREIRDSVAVKAGDVNKAIKIDRKPKATTLTLKEEVRLPLKYFGARQGRKGVSYKISKTGGRTTIPGAFGPNIPRLGKHVFQRVGTNRLPIVKLFGISPWGTFVSKKMYKPTVRHLQSTFGKRVRHEVNFLINQAKQKRV